MYRAGPSDFGLLRLALRLRIRPGVSSVQLAQSKAKPQRYRRRQPEFTVLYRVVQRHWQTYRERAEASGPLPQFVVDEFEQYLRCGVLAHGAVLVAESIEALMIDAIHFCENAEANYKAAMLGTVTPLSEDDMTLIASKLNRAAHTGKL